MEESKVKTIREIAGGFWAYLYDNEIEDIDWKTKERIVGYLARYLLDCEGCVIENDEDLPVTKDEPIWKEH